MAEDSFQKGVGTYVVSFGDLPRVKMADIRKQVGRYKLEKVALKVTTRVTEKAGKYYAGDAALANPKEEDLLKEVAAKKSGALVLSGTLTEDDKGMQTLTLSKVAPAAGK